MLEIMNTKPLNDCTVKVYIKLSIIGPNNADTAWKACTIAYIVPIKKRKALGTYSFNL